MVPFVLLRDHDLGEFPDFLNEDDPRPAVEQLNSNYAHGGGWHSSNYLTFDQNNLTLTYPGDPPYRCVAIGKMRDEVILVFEYDLVMVLQQDGSHDVARMN